MNEKKCPKCCAPNHTKYWACQRCHENADRRLKAARARRLAAGTCAQCDDDPVPGRQLCPYHLERKKAAGSKYAASLASTRGARGSNQYSRKARA